MFTPPLKEFVRGSAQFASEVEFDLGPPKILLHDKANFGVNMSHLFWSVSDSAIRRARISAAVTQKKIIDHSFESQNIEFMFRSDFPLMVGIEIPLSTPKRVVSGAIDSQIVNSLCENMLPLFDKSFWDEHGLKCGAHDIPATLEIYDDAFLLRFSDSGELFWYDKLNAILLGDGNTFLGIAHRFPSPNFKAQLLAPALNFFRTN